LTIVLLTDKLTETTKGDYFMGYTYTNVKGVKYYLNSQQIRLKNGSMNNIYFFSKDMRPDTEADMPEGRIVKETQRSGLPVLAKSL
jgi:hypothetical protein